MTSDYFFLGCIAVVASFATWGVLEFLRVNWHVVYARLTGKNHEKTPVGVIVDQMNEPRPLPLGRTEFQEWAHRIITGAMLPVIGDEDPIAFIESQKFALASEIMHLGPTESHKPDAFFIHRLRKVANNQVAGEMMREIKDAQKERMAKKAAAEAARDDPLSVAARLEVTTPA